MARMMNALALDVPPSDVTRDLQRWSRGDPHALDECLPFIYRELSRIASRSLRREKRPLTLQTSDIVHETWLKLGDQRRAHWRSRAHFFATSSLVMRRLLVDHARQRRCLKRGGDVVRLSLDEAVMLDESTDAAVLALEEALETLQRADRELCDVITMRFFGGLENAEMALALGVSTRTVIRRWKTARAWLKAYLNRRSDHDFESAETSGPS